MRVDAKIAGVVIAWLIVGMAIFGGWAWIALVASGAAPPHVPFPLMGFVTPVAL